MQDDDGIIPRAIADLFEARNDYKDVGQVTIELTCLEIYKDELRDLLLHLPLLSEVAVCHVFPLQSPSSP